jgi:hypothetical protein
MQMTALHAASDAERYGMRRRGCNARNMNPEKAEGLSPELQRALEPLLAALASVSQQIREYNLRGEESSVLFWSFVELRHTVPVPRARSQR